MNILKISFLLWPFVFTGTFIVMALAVGTMTLLGWGWILPPFLVPIEFVGLSAGLSGLGTVLLVLNEGKKDEMS